MNKRRRTLPKAWNGSASHLWYLLVLPAYLAAFFWMEHVVDGSGAYWVSYLPLDDRIPFCEWFVIPYVLWYPFLVSVGLYALIREPQEFCRYMTYIGIGFMGSILLFFLFPNGQDLRPVVMPRDNPAARLVEAIYAADTNTNVCPSMHVVGSLGAMAAVFHCKGLRRPWWRIGAVGLAAAVIASTVLIKQHSVLDIFAAIPYAAVVYALSYRLIHPTRCPGRSTAK